MREDVDFRGLHQYRANRERYVAMVGMPLPFEALDDLSEIARFVQAAGFVDVQVRRLVGLETRIAPVLDAVPAGLGGRYPIHLVTASTPATT
jgi:hypothetical protein